MTTDLQVSDADNPFDCLFRLPIHGGPTLRGKTPHELVKAMAAFIDGSGIIEQINVWRTEDDPTRARKGGRPHKMDDRTILVLLMILIVSGEKALISLMTDLASHGLTASSRELLQIKTARPGSMAQYHRTRRAMLRLTRVFDSAPGTTGYRPTRAEFEAIKASRDMETCAKKQVRAEWVANQLLEATFWMLPPRVRAEWAGNLCVDATPVAIWGKRGSPVPDRKNPNPDERLSPEADAGWYHRDADHRDAPDGRGRRNPKSKWAWDAHLTVTVANDPTRIPDFPLLVLGMSLDKPAGRVAENAMITIQSIVDRGHPAESSSATAPTSRTPGWRSYKSR